MNQSRTDSIMEVACNIAVGLIISTIANALVIPVILGAPLSLHANVLISVIFTVISIVRSYVLRRLFNGKSVWEGIKGTLSSPAERTVMTAFGRIPIKEGQTLTEAKHQALTGFAVGK